MPDDSEPSIGAERTANYAPRRKPTVDVSLSDERTLGGGDAAGQDTFIDDIEVVDLDARYKIEGTLGQGGMGAVLLATDTRLDRKVAIKRILGEAAGNRMAVQRFLTEAKAIAALNHSNIVQIYDYGRAKDGPFLIMEYVDGGSLLDRCRESALPLDEAIAVACQLCDGLARAHDLGIIHRDIKPANVLLTQDGIPKLTDFGLAKTEAADHGQTMTGAVLGTPDFMPPEQRRDAAEVDSRSDLWSLAATVYQMVTGRSPKIIRFNNIPKAMQDVLARALEERKDARYQTARELRDVLKAATGGTGVATKASVPPPVVADDLREGQCKACGTVTSDLTKKFCRNPKCGASLRVPCLKCDAQIPVWDGVCGECGGNQPALLNAHIKSLSARRLEAERLVAESAFDAAVQCVEGIAEEIRPECAEIAAWAKSFVAATTEEAARRQTAARQSLEEARKHVEACDYPAAIHAVETILEPFRDTQAIELLSECRLRQEEADWLITEIAGRIKRKEMTGLLPLVERATELRKDRLDLAKIRGQLQERRDAVLSRANAAIESGDIRQAAAVIAGCDAEDLGEQGAGLIARVKRASALEAKLAKAIAAAKSDGVVTPDEAHSLLVMCEEYLQVDPQGAKIQELAKRCRDIISPPPSTNSVGIEIALPPTGKFMADDASGEWVDVPFTRTSRIALVLVGLALLLALVALTVFVLALRSLW
jgi:serine/threonine protein kinase